MELHLQLQLQVQVQPQATAIVQVLQISEAHETMCKTIQLQAGASASDSNKI